MSHQEIAYQDRKVDFGGGPATPVWSADRSSFDLESTCPACAGPMKRTVRRGLPTGNKSLWRREKNTPPPEPDRVTLVCACGFPHAQRPADSTETGCGALWKVPLA